MIFYYYNILKYLSFRKALNWVRLWAGFHYSRYTGVVQQWGLPVFASIEPTTSCNLRCPQCPSGLREFTRPTGMLEKKFFTSVIDQMSAQLFGLTFYFQGEPYLNPDFLDMVAIAHGKKVYTATSTNAHYLNESNARLTVESGLDLLTISVDGITQEVYEQYRVGGQLIKVIEGTKEILKQKKLLGSKTPHVVWQFVVFSSNEAQIDKVKSIGKELGVDEVRIKTAQIYDFENSTNLIPKNPKYARYIKNASGQFEIRNKLLNQCWRMWQACVMTWDGSIVPCCFDKDAKYKMGNLQHNSFKEIWHSNAYKSFRASILSDRKSIDICKNCTEGTQVWT